MESKKYYHSVKRKIEGQRAWSQGGNQTTTVAKKKPIRAKSIRYDLRDMSIPKFPAHLKKRLWENLDLRYFWILLASFIFNIGLMLLIYKNTSLEISEESMAKIQKKYARLIVDKTFADRKEDLEKKTPWSARSSKPATEKTTTRSGDEDAGRARRRATRANTSQETKMLDVESFYDERTAGRIGSGGNRNAVSAQIGNVGLLEYMKGKIITSKVDAAFLDHTDRMNRNFVRTIDGLNASDLAQAGLGNGGYAGGTGAGNGGSTGQGPTNQIRTERMIAKPQAREIFGADNPLEEIKTTRMEKVETFEKTTPTMSEMASRKPRTVKRTAAEISATLREHNQAIQDCYKTALRKEVQLKGKIIVRISINPEGKVVDVQIVSSTLNHEGMEQCIVNRIKRWNDFGICPTQTESISFQQTYNFGE
ncbi:TonB family protein [candidate division KSB1 bacterium]|nr:TonB family protein [candidate division KSB1 bacterium]